MRITECTTLDWLLAYNTAAVTAEELYNASWDGPLEHADAGFKERYEQLAEAINKITVLFGRREYCEEESRGEPGRGLL